MGRTQYEMHRTCSRCQTDWYVPAEVAKAKKPNRLQMAGAKMQSAGARMSPVLPNAGPETRVARLEALSARIEESRRCPSCGSQAWTEEKVEV